MLTTADVYEFDMEAANNNVAHHNVLHVALLRNRTASEMQTACLAFANAFKEIWRPQQNTGFSWNTWKAVQVAGAGITYSTFNCRRSGGDVYSGVFTGTLTGALGGADIISTTMAVVTSLRTGLVGRSKNGRIFVGGWNETNAAGNNLASANVAILQTNMDSFLATYGVAGTNLDFAWGVFSRFIASGCKYVPALPKPVLTHVQPGDQATALTRIQTATVAALLAPMHRRKLGVGL